MSIGVIMPAWSAPDDPDRTVTRSEDVLKEAARQKHTISEATSIQLKLVLGAVPKEDRFADKSTPTTISPAGFSTDGKLQFTDNMYSLGMMQQLGIRTGCLSRKSHPQHSCVAWRPVPAVRTCPERQESADTTRRASIHAARRTGQRRPGAIKVRKEYSGRASVCVVQAAENCRARDAATV